MANNIPINVSSPFAGLGTAQTTIVTAGFYTCEFKSFLPYMASGSQPQSASPSAESTDITLAADSSGSLNSTFFTFNIAGDQIGYYVWYNINSAGVDPAVAGRTGIAVTGATNATAATLATATRAAINAAIGSGVAAPSVVISGATTHVIITNVGVGQSTNAANGTASPGFTYSITQGSYGTPEISGLSVAIKQNSTILATFGAPSATQPIMGGSARFSASVGDVISVVLSSLSGADNALNAVKSIINLYQGV